MNTMTYAPILDTVLPAFVGGYCKIPFAISEYDSASHSQIQYTIRNAQSNVLISQENTEILRDEYDNPYFIAQVATLTTFVPYKVQIRYILGDNKYSEWSSAILIKKITTPNLKLEGKVDIINPNIKVIIKSNSLSFKGTIKFEENNQLVPEFMEKYRITISKEGKVVDNSGELYIDNTNIMGGFEFYSLKDYDTGDYEIKFEFISNSGYVYTKCITIRLETSSNRFEDWYIDSVTPIHDFGYMELHINKLSDNSVNNFFIYRAKETNNTEWGKMGAAAAHKTNTWGSIVEESGSPLELRWEQIKVQSSGDINSDTIVIKDLTIENGVKYYYKLGAIQGGNIIFGETYDKAPPIKLQDMFLVGDNRALRIAFRPTVSSYKNNVIESKVDTLGSKYGFIRRNANVFYKSYPISGLIALEEECEGVGHEFTYTPNDNEGKKYDLLDEMTYYSTFLTQEEIEELLNEEKDIFYRQKLFRDKVEDFLYDGKAKLFKTAAEGNHIVRLMDINFSPEAGLNRMVYTFSATAHEVADDNLDNYNYYNIIDIKPKTQESKSRKEKEDTINEEKTLPLNIADEDNDGICYTYARLKFDNVKPRYNSTYSQVGYTFYVDGQEIFTPYKRFVLDSPITFNILTPSHEEDKIWVEEYRYKYYSNEAESTEEEGAVVDTTTCIIRTLGQFKFNSNGELSGKYINIKDYISKDLKDKYKIKKEDFDIKLKRISVEILEYKFFPNYMPFFNSISCESFGDVEFINYIDEEGMVYPFGHKEFVYDEYSAEATEYFTVSESGADLLINYVAEFDMEV